MVASAIPFFMEGMAVDPKKTGRTWKYVEELTPDEQKYWQIDSRWSHEIPRDKEFPKLPETRYPYHLPYSGEELSSLAEAGGGTVTMCGIQSHHGYHITRTKDRAGVVTKSDQICNTVKHYKTYAQYLYETKPGTEYSDYLVTVVSPPEQNGTVWLSKFYKDGPGVSKVEDRWIYVPSLRRVRRFNGANGEDYVVGGTETFDDVFLRDFWKYDSKVIGVDILYQVANYKQPFGPIRAAYRQDGGIDCYVVLHKPFQKGYYLSQWISWYDRKTLKEVRTEQWDRRGNFKHILENGMVGQANYFGKTVYPWDEAIKGGLTPGGEERRAILHAACLWQRYDFELDLQTFTIPHNDPRVSNVELEQFGPTSIFQSGETPTAFFQPQRIEHPFVKPVPTVRFAASDFPPPPPLYRGKFSKYRNVVLPNDIQNKIKKEEQNKRALF